VIGRRRRDDRRGAAAQRAVIFAFDLLRAEHKDRRSLPLVRKAALQALLRRSRRLCCAAHGEEDGAGMYAGCRHRPRWDRREARCLGVPRGAMQGLAEDQDSGRDGAGGEANGAS
jgi:hypothetical protein